MGHVEVVAAQVNSLIGFCLFAPLSGYLLMLWITATAKAGPAKTSHLKNEVSSSKNIVGVATQIITNALINVIVLLLFGGLLFTFSIKLFRVKLNHRQTTCSRRSDMPRFCRFWVKAQWVRRAMKFIRFCSNPKAPQKVKFDLRELSRFFFNSIR